jgi:hypothetical protein
MPLIVKNKPGESSIRRTLLRSPYTFLVVLFAISRTVYYLLGVRFDARGLTVFFQLLDPELLRHKLLQSLFYLHMQPPGYNLFVGVILKLFPHTYVTAFHGIHLVFGVSIMCLMFHLMRCLGVSARFSLVATALFIVSPEVILFENYLLYEYLLVFILMVSAALLFHFFIHRSIGGAIGFLVCQFCLVLLRNHFHLVYFIMVFALLLYFTKRNRRLVTGVGSVLLAIVVALYLKNLILFGHFASSTWLGMCMGTIVTHQLTPQERQHLASQGQLCPATEMDPCSSVWTFRPYIKMPAKTSIPALDQEFKSDGYSINFNHLAFLQVQKLFMKDGLYILLHYPKAYMRSIVIAWFAYFLPADDYPFFDLNLPRIHAIQRFFDIVFFGQFKQAPGKALRQLYAAGSKLSLILYTGTFLLIGLPTLFVFGIWYLFKGVRRRTLDAPQAFLIGFMLFNIAYCTAVANFLSSFENNRYRFPLDGFFVILAAFALNRVWHRIMDK